MPRRGRQRSQRGYRNRRVGTREVKQRFLIVCEGEQTEPNYFKAFRVPRDVVIRVLGMGRDPLTLVQEADRLRENEDYDQVWVVFDQDDVPAERFNRALQEAEGIGVRVAYSNQAFELWYVVHFEFVNTARTRADYVNRLHALLGGYSKRDTDLYERLFEKQSTALRHAAQLLRQYEPVSPVNDDPSTTVHLLVEQLNRFV